MSIKPRSGLQQSDGGFGAWTLQALAVTGHLAAGMVSVIACHAWVGTGEAALLEWSREDLQEGC